jgi:hypothetical protein
MRNGEGESATLDFYTQCLACDTVMNRGAATIVGGEQVIIAVAAGVSSCSLSRWIGRWFSFPGWPWICTSGYTNMFLPHPSALFPVGGQQLPWSVKLTKTAGLS